MYTTSWSTAAARPGTGPERAVVIPSRRVPRRIDGRQQIGGQRAAAARFMKDSRGKIQHFDCLLFLVSSCTATIEVPGLSRNVSQIDIVNDLVSLTQSGDAAIRLRNMGWLLGSFLCSAQSKRQRHRGLENLNWGDQQAAGRSTCSRGSAQ